MKKKQPRKKIPRKPQASPLSESQQNICINARCKLRSKGCKGFEGCPGFLGKN